MSIVPAGKRREQMNQGELRNRSILESDLFYKFGQGASALVDDPVEQQQPNREMQQTMNSGGLNHDGLATELENQWKTQPQPGNGAGMGSPAARFLGPNPDDNETQADPNAIWKAERAKIRRFIGNEFGMRLVQTPDGSYTVTLKPPQGTPVQDPSGFMDALLQYVGGASVNEEDTPALTDEGGNLTLKYRPSGSAPEKIRPPGKRR